MLYREVGQFKTSYESDGAIFPIAQDRWFIVVLIAFAFALVRGPAYRYAPEDNLAYAHYVPLHQAAVAFVERHLPHAEVLSAWPGTDEVAKPWLGYTATPVPTIAILIALP